MAQIAATTIARFGTPIFDRSVRTEATGAELEAGRLYHEGVAVTRRPNLAPYAGMFVALSVPGDTVIASADTPEELFRLLDEKPVGHVTIMRAPRLDEPVYVGLG